MPRGVVAVSESGLKTAADLRGCGALGYRAFLIGERFMTAADPGASDCWRRCCHEDTERGGQHEGIVHRVLW